MSSQHKLHRPQIRIPATYMRGGTSKGVFFALNDLPEVAQKPGPARDNLLLRVIGSPDPYAKQTDGMGGANTVPPCSRRTYDDKDEQWEPEWESEQGYGPQWPDEASHTRQ